MRFGIKAVQRWKKVIAPFNQFPWTSKWLNITLNQLLWRNHRLFCNYLLRRHFLLSFLSHFFASIIVQMSVDKKFITIGKLGGWCIIISPTALFLHFAFFPFSSETRSLFESVLKWSSQCVLLVKLKPFNFVLLFLKIFLSGSSPTSY